MDEANLQKSYAESNREFLLRQSKIGIIIALVLVPAGITLDYFVYPDLLLDIFIIRIVCDIFLAGALALHFVPFFQKRHQLLAYLWPAIIYIAICYMIYLSEGANSPYYAGLNLVTICVTFLLPLTFIEALIINLINIAIYSVTIFLHSYTVNVDIALLYNNVYFLVLTGIISSVASYANTKQRINEFRLQYELDIRNKELSELDQLKSQFFANVSHELRTPLTLILTPIQDLLQNKKITGKTSETLGLIEQNALRLLKLVNDLLDVIQLEVGKKTLSMQTIDLNRVLNNMVESIRYLAESKQIGLQSNLSNMDITIKADLSALEKIIINLLNNAIKFTDAGGLVKIASNIQQNNVIIEVSDTGIGISSAELPHIFERFRQADGSSTRKYQGTGLGLALVKELVEQHHGTIRAESTLGKGTSLFITLPISTEKSEAIPQVSVDNLQQIHKAADLHVANAPSSTEEIIDASQNTDKPELLIADDEPDILAYLVDLLKHDYKVTQAVDGKQALAIAQDKQPAVMILDFMLPHMSGLEVCGFLKNNPDTRQTKIILLTARTDEQTKLDVLNAGADDFLTKPFSSVEIKTRLRNLLQTAELEHALREEKTELQQTLHQLKQTEAQLVHSEKINAIGHLSAGLLHEISNPLNYAMTASQLLQMDNTVQEDEDLLDSCNDITDGLGRINRIIMDLRTFAYPEQANQQHVFSIEDAVETSLRFVSHETKQINIEKELDNLGVLGSQSGVVQVLVNLFTNAARALKDASGATIRIKSEINGDRLHINVMDNGSGISEENASKIFDPFFTTREVGDGMGLGLSICYTIIQNHGGTLSLDRSVEGWTVFNFDLPLSGEN